MTVMRSECVGSRVGAVIVGSLSFIGSIIGMVPVGISLSDYLHRSYSINALPELSLQIFLVLHAFSSVLMIFGAMKGRPVMMLPCLGTFIGAIVVSIAMSIGVLMNYVVFMGWGPDMGNDAIFVGVTWLITAVEILLCAIVYNHYDKIVSGKLPQSSHSHTMSEPIMKSDLIYHKV